MSQFEEWCQPDDEESENNNTEWEDSTDEPQWLKTLRFLEEPIDVPLIDKYPVFKNYLSHEKEPEWLADFECGMNGLEKEPLTWPSRLIPNEELLADNESVQKGVQTFISNIKSNDYLNDKVKTEGNSRTAGNKKRGYHQWLFYNQPSVAPWSLYNYSLSAVPPGINLNIGDDEEIPPLLHNPGYIPRTEPLRLRPENHRPHPSPVMMKEPSADRMLKTRSFENAGQELGIIAAVGTSSRATPRMNNDEPAGPARIRKRAQSDRVSDQKRKTGRRPHFLYATNQQSLLKPATPAAYRYRQHQFFRSDSDV